MLNVPPERVIAEYFVPEGKCVATIEAPIRGSSAEFFTEPPIADVVICAIKDDPAAKANTNKKSILLSISF
jgi:hypothetical protein